MADQPTTELDVNDVIDQLTAEIAAKNRELAIAKAQNLALTRQLDALQKPEDK